MVARRAGGDLEIGRADLSPADGLRLQQLVHPIQQARQGREVAAHVLIAGLVDASRGGDDGRNGAPGDRDRDPGTGALEVADDRRAIAPEPRPDEAARNRLVDPVAPRLCLDYGP
jgi:hypothetical protein